MVDRKARDTFAELLRHFVAGQITNEEFRDQIPHSKDLAILEIWYIAAWPLYDDSDEHTLTGKYRVPDGERREIAKCVLFLKTDQEYQWPKQCGLKNDLMYLLWLVSLGRIEPRFNVEGNILSRINKLFDAAGDLEAWPFVSLKNLETARKRPPYLTG